MVQSQHIADTAFAENAANIDVDYHKDNVAVHVVDARHVADFLLQLNDLEQMMFVVAILDFAAIKIQSKTITKNYYIKSNKLSPKLQ